MQRSPARIVVFEPDLIFSSRIESVATTLGGSVKITSECAELIRQLTDSLPALLILNLDALGKDVARVGDAVRGKSLVCVGYYSHVNTGMAEEATRSGIGMVLTRGVFVKRIEEICARVLRAK
jgi:hypothetical protein